MIVWWRNRKRGEKESRRKGERRRGKGVIGEKGRKSPTREALVPLPRVHPPLIDHSLRWRGALNLDLWTFPLLLSQIGSLNLSIVFQVFGHFLLQILTIFLKQLSVALILQI